MSSSRTGGASTFVPRQLQPFSRVCRFYQILAYSGKSFLLKYIQTRRNNENIRELRCFRRKSELILSGTFICLCSKQQYFEGWEFWLFHQCKQCHGLFMYSVMDMVIGAFLIPLPGRISKLTSGLPHWFELLLFLFCIHFGCWSLYHCLGVQQYHKCLPLPARTV